MRIRPPIDDPAQILRPAALVLCALLVLRERATGEDEPFAKRFDTGFAKAMIHSGACTVALRQSSFTYATPYDCRTIADDYRGQPLDGLPPEAVVARSLIARLQHDPVALAACYDEDSQATVSRDFTRYLDSDEAKKEEDPSHFSVALIAGAYAADELLINFRFQDHAGETKFEWHMVLKHGGRGWRLIDETRLHDFISSFSVACSSAMAAHGTMSSEELAGRSVFRILTTPTVHAQLVQPQELHQGDLAMAVMISLQEPPLRLRGVLDAAGDAGILALSGAWRLYAHDGGNEELGRLWYHDSPGSPPASPFDQADGKATLQFCHGAIRGDDSSIYLLGDGNEAISDVMMCVKDARWKLMNVPPADAIDSWLWVQTFHYRLWSRMAELLRTHGR